MRRIDWIAVAGITALWAVVDAFGADDAALFNYVNNVSDASPWVSQRGYLHLIPSLVAAALAPASLGWQAIGYRAAALLATLVLYRELRALFRASGDEGEASALAFAVVLVLGAVDPAMLANLSWVNWTACLAAITHLLRTAAGTTALTAGSFALVAAGLLTTPLGVLCAPICAWHAWRAVGHRRRRLLGLGALVVAWHGLQIGGFAYQPDDASAPARSIATALGNHLHDALPLLLLALASVTVSVAHSLWRRAVASSPGPTLDVADDVMLLYLLVASTMGFWLSPRLVEQGYEVRYLLFPAYCAGVGLARLGLRLAPPARGRAVAAALAFGVVASGLVANELRRGPAVLWWQKYRFLVAAAEFRGHCATEDVRVFEDEPSSAIVLCRQRALPPGVHPIEHFTPEMGGYDPDTPVSRRPAIVVPDRWPGGW